MKRLIGILALASLTIGSVLAQDAYATDGNGDLYRVNLPTATATLIGNHGQFLEGLARNETTGDLFGTSSGGELYSIDKTTGAATDIGSTGLGNVEGLDFAGDFLFGTDFNSPVTINSIDPLTGAATAFVTSDMKTGAVRAMAFNSAFTNAYMIGDEPVFQSLYAMPTSGVTTLVGTLNTTDFVAAIDNFGGDDFWGLATNGDVLRIDIATGGTTLIGNTGGHVWLDMTTAEPVPEPATMAALGLGCAALLRRRRK